MSKANAQCSHESDALNEWASKPQRQDFTSTLHTWNVDRKEDLRRLLPDPVEENQYVYMSARPLSNNSMVSRAITHQPGVIICPCSRSNLSHAKSRPDEMWGEPWNWNWQDAVLIYIYHMELFPVCSRREFLFLMISYVVAISYWCIFEINAKKCFSQGFRQVPRFFNRQNMERLWLRQLVC